MNSICVGCPVFFPTLNFHRTQSNKSCLTIRENGTKAKKETNQIGIWGRMESPSGCDSNHKSNLGQDNHFEQLIYSVNGVNWN